MSNMVPQRNNTTSKIQKYIGSEEWINPRTGEIENLGVSRFQEKDVNFTKVWMRNFLIQVEEITTQKFKVATYIMENARDDNIFIGTVRAISKKTGISIDTVQRTIKILIKNNFMNRVQAGVYMINMDTMFKGSHGKRIRLLNEYTELGQPDLPEPTNKEKKENLKKSIAYLQNELDKLE